MKLSFSNRIAIYFLLTTAALIVVVFATVYLVVYRTVYDHLDNDLNAESLEVYNGIVTLDDRMIITNPMEWEEFEHHQIEVNPTFIQITDTTGSIIKKTPNLNDGQLDVFPELNEKSFFNTYLASAAVRQVQLPITNHLGKTFGYLSIASPLEDSQMVLRNLRIVLLLAFPLALLILYFTIDLLVNRNIRPVHDITEAARKITRENLNLRVGLPRHQDELYTLAGTMNNLLNRLQDAVEREKQFTADASHELRTPLSSLKGTLEVMLRKERQPGYYIEKTRQNLESVNRMSGMVEQLLLLARLEDKVGGMKTQKIKVETLVHASLVNIHNLLDEKNLQINLQVNPGAEVYSDPFMLGQILENLLSNAAKYSKANGEIGIRWEEDGQKKTLVIRDNGIGMDSNQLKKIFERFYRADTSRSFSVKGNGLGMPIVKRLCDILALKISISSTPGEGTTVKLEF